MLGNLKYKRLQEWTLLLKIKNKKINFHIFFLSFIALKKCTNLQDLWHPLKAHAKKKFWKKFLLSISKNTCEKSEISNLFCLPSTRYSYVGTFTDQSLSEKISFSGPWTSFSVKLRKNILITKRAIKFAIK
jgi:hypothetical protein